MKRRPRDINQLGKLVVDIAVGNVQDNEPTSGKARGGHARAASLTSERRKEIADKASKARWGKVAANTAR